MSAGGKAEHIDITRSRSQLGSNPARALEPRDGVAM